MTVRDERVSVLVVGGGIMGLATAYHLAERGQKDVLVIERSYLCAGASGRNGGGVRAHWSSEKNVRIMQESLQRIAHFTKRFGIHVWFRRGGYLFLARSEQKAAALAGSVEVQRQCGLSTQLVNGVQAARIVPELDTSNVLAASWSPDDAVVFPWAFIWGYAQAAVKLGVEVRTHTELLAIERTAGRATAAIVRAPDGSETRVRFDTLVCACGAWSKQLAALVDVDLPTHPHRHEICSTEPLKPWLGPLVADLENGLYFSQSTRGEIVGGLGNEYVPGGFDQGSSYTFLARYARALTEACPRLGPVRVLRQWAGLYDLTADANPIVGFTDEAPGIYFLAGFMGHGFMMAPAVGEKAAAEIVTGRVPGEFQTWNLQRFRSGELLTESMIIG